MKDDRQLESSREMGAGPDRRLKPIGSQHGAQCPYALD